MGVAGVALTFIFEKLQLIDNEQLSLNLRFNWVEILILYARNCEKTLPINQVYIDTETRGQITIQFENLAFLIFSLTRIQEAVL